MKSTFLFLISLALPAVCVAGDLTIPNTFQPNTPARAAEVNENFNAVEGSVDDNALQVTNAATALNSVVSNVDANTANIANVAEAVAALQATSDYSFVGFSTGTTNGAAGEWGLKALCQADFGPDSRMATSQEVVDSTLIPTLTANGAWVRLVLVAASSKGSSGGVQIWDYGGYSTSNTEVNCVGWASTSGSNSGLAVLPSGSVRNRGCDEALPVACSIPE